MALRTDAFDLGGLRLSTGEGRRLELTATLDPYELGGGLYPVEPPAVGVVLDVSRTTGGGYALRLRFQAQLSGACMRCLEPAAPSFEVDAREISQPGEVEDLQSPYVEHEVLDLRAWARDALALMLPAQIVCDPECAGLCPACGINLSQAGPGHGHERQPDPRWAKLADLKLDG